MKECPVCKESFVDDFNFCEFDGTPLDRSLGGTTSVGSTTGGSNRIWSFVGVALLLGAVFLSALSIIFFPRGSSSSPLVQKPPEGATSNLPASKPVANSEAAPSQDRAAISDKSDAALVGGDDTNQANANRAGLRRNSNSRNSNEQAAMPNPKSAAMSDEDKDSASRTAEKAPAPVVSAGDRSPAPKGDPTPVSETRPRTAQPSAQSNTDAKRQTASTSRGANSSQSANRNDKEKKGGFLKVFKKIFGKD